MSKPVFRVLILLIVLTVLILVSYTYVKKRFYYAELSRQYENGLKIIYDKGNYYYPESQLAYYDSCLAQPSSNPRITITLLLWKGECLLKLGKEKEAVDVLKNVVKYTAADKNDPLGMDVRKNLAIAYLRLGERNNCVSNHSSMSCIFPIQGKAVYMDPSASQEAIDVLEELLRLNPGEEESRWLLNLAYMTIGEYPGKVPAKFLIPGLDTDTSSYQVKPFKDMAGDLKLNNSMNMSGGAIVEDFNNDGYLDIVTSSISLRESMHYFKNNGDGTFTDASESSGLSKIKGGLNIIQADYNNDGFMDILVLRGAWMGEYGKQPKTLLRNNGDGTFTDVTLKSGIISFHPTQTAVWADFNNDGWVDLFIGNETSDSLKPHPCELYINNQDGTFSNVTRKAGCGLLGFVKGVVAADYNKDGWPDIFVSTLSGKYVLLKNKGIKSRIPQFEDATHEAGLDKDSTVTFPTCFMDYDNDGWPDIFVCGYKYPGNIVNTAIEEALHQPLKDNSEMYLYHNNHDGTFTNVSKSMGLNHPVFGMGFNFGDIDNDGWLDMYIGTGDPDFKSLVPNRLFKNIGGRQFVDVTRSARVGNLQKGHGVAFADIDNDGDQDIFAETGGAFSGDAYYNSLYINPGQNNNKWISVQLEGTTSNRSAIGATISVSFTENGVKRTVYRDVNSGGSFGCSPLRKEIGIGEAKRIDELIIKWPGSGNVQVFRNITPCQFLKIKEGSNQIEKMNLKTLHFNDQPTMPMMHMIN